MAHGLPKSRRSGPRLTGEEGDQLAGNRWSRGCKECRLRSSSQECTRRRPQNDKPNGDQQLGWFFATRAVMSNGWTDLDRSSEASTDDSKWKTRQTPSAGIMWAQPL